MSANFRRFLLVAAVLAAPAAQAQWTGKAELGMMLSNGNTEARSANAKLDLTHQGAVWKNNIYAAVLYGDNADFATAERYEARWQLDRKITDKLSWFVGLRGEKDMFGAFNYQATASTGVTYQWIDNPKTKFDTSVGAGYRELQPQQLTKLPSGEVTQRTLLPKDNGAVGTLGSNFEHAFTDTTKLTNKLLAEFGAANSTLQDDIALAVSMTDTLALSVGVGVRYNSDPPLGAVSTDTLFTVNLVYNIK